MNEPLASTPDAAVSIRRALLHPHTRVGGGVNSDLPIDIMLLLRHRPGSTLPSPGEMGEIDPRRRRYLTHEDFAEIHGADPADLEVVRAFAAAHDLRVESESLARRTVRLSGTAERVGRAFGVDLVWLDHLSAGNVGHLHDITLPAELVDRVEWIFGFDDRSIGSPKSRFRTKPAHHVVSVDELMHYYDFPEAYDGSGECIGVIELGGGYLRSDIDQFFAGSPGGPPEILDDGVNSPGGSPIVDMEVTMDIQIAGSAAPGARLVVYFGSGSSVDNWYEVLARAIHDRVNRPSVLTISWSAAEATGWTAEEVGKLSVLFQEAALLGITICVGSGDSGTTFPNGTGPFSAPPTTEFPASDPHVLACGGTALQMHGSRIAHEVVWNSLAETFVESSQTSQGHAVEIAGNGGASGGGVSMYFERPSYQADASVPSRICSTFGPSGLGPPELFRGRGVPDVAASASLDTGYSIRFQGADVVGGGTSASAPLWAGLVARLNQALGCRLGFFNPLLYRMQSDGNGSAFRQVRHGNNGGYTVDPADWWNPCVGLGTPRGSALLEALLGAPATTAAEGAAEPGAT